MEQPGSHDLPGCWLWGARTAGFPVNRRLIRSLLTLCLLLGLAPALGPLGPTPGRAQSRHPDLVPVAVTASVDCAFWFDSITALWTVENRSENAISNDLSWGDEVRLSTDATRDREDSLLKSSWPASSRMGPVAAGERYAVAMDAAVPDVPAGRYCLLVAVETIPLPSGLAVHEADETNNVLSVPFTVEAAR